MKKLILKIKEFFLKLSGRKIQKQNVLSSETNGAKTYATSSATLEIKNQMLDEMTKELQEKITPIIKDNVKTPEKILDFIEQNGTSVYKIKHAKKILRIIKEDQNFITPLKGLKALYINLFLRKEISFKTPEMFIVDDSSINIINIAYQLYRWYGWKMKMAGYDDETQENFRKVWEYGKISNIQKLSYNNLVNVKEAIKRDVEALNFVIKLADENSIDNNKDV